MPNNDDDDDCGHTKETCKNHLLHLWAPSAIWILASFYTQAAYVWLTASTKPVGQHPFLVFIHRRIWTAKCTAISHKKQLAEALKLELSQSTQQIQQTCIIISQCCSLQLHVTSSAPACYRNCNKTTDLYHAALLLFSVLFNQCTFKELFHVQSRPVSKGESFGIQQQAFTGSSCRPTNIKALNELYYHIHLVQNWKKWKSFFSGDSNVVTISSNYFTARLVTNVIDIQWCQVKPVQ